MITLRIPQENSHEKTHEISAEISLCPAPSRLPRSFHGNFPEESVYKKEKWFIFLRELLWLRGVWLPG